jgi:RNA polymerase sigma-70 factor (ECF subfamily)
MSRVAAGDEAAVSALYDATSHRVFGLALRILRNREDAEEVTLDVYAQVWRSRVPHDPARGSVLGFLLMVARTRAVDLLRSRSKRGSVEERVEDLLDSDELPWVEPVRGDMLASRRLRAALASLPRKQREAIEAAYFAGLTHTEVASALGEPLGTVKTRIRDGLLALRYAMAVTEEGIA